MAECGDVLLVAGDTTVIETVPDPAVILVDAPSLTVIDNEIVETTLVDNHQIIILQSDGGSGPAGVSGGTFTVVAGENLQAYHAVYLDTSGLARHADHDVLADGWRLFGVTKTAALTGENVDVVADGLMVTNPIWTVGQLYLGSSGILTSTPVTTGFALPVAAAVTASELIVRPQSPVYLI